MKAITKLTTLLLSTAVVASAIAQETPKTNIRSMEFKYRENALNAKTSYAGSTVKFQLYVDKAEEVNGKPQLQTSILFNDGMVLYCNANLKAEAVKTAVKLKAADLVEITGVLKGREILSKDEVQISGYSGSVYNGNGGGGSVSGGTVTRTWTVYTLSSASVRLIESNEERQAKAAKIEAQKKELESLWIDSIRNLDKAKGATAIKRGLSVKYINDTLYEISRIDPARVNYDAIVDYYGWCFEQQGIDFGKALVDAISSERPKLFAEILKRGGLNFKHKFQNGDNILHYMVKDQTFSINPANSPKNLRMFFSKNYAEIIRQICESPLAKGLADEPDAYGRTVRDYFKSESMLSHGEGYKTLREVILNMN